MCYGLFVSKYPLLWCQGLVINSQGKDFLDNETVYSLYLDKYIKGKMTTSVE